MVLNLLSNALKFTDEGDVITITTYLEIIDEEKFLKISVRDTGIGISKEDQKKLFKLFGFLDGSKSKNPQGIGLGLYISQKIVESFQGGIIDLDSEVGEGTMFTFKFKLSQMPKMYLPKVEVVEKPVIKEKKEVSKMDTKIYMSVPRKAFKEIIDSSIPRINTYFDFEQEKMIEYDGDSKISEGSEYDSDSMVEGNKYKIDSKQIPKGSYRTTFVMD